MAHPDLIDFPPRTYLFGTISLKAHSIRDFEISLISMNIFANFPRLKKSFAKILHLKSKNRGSNKSQSCALFCATIKISATFCNDEVPNDILIWRPQLSPPSDILSISRIAKRLYDHFVQKYLLGGGRGKEGNISTEAWFQNMKSHIEYPWLFLTDIFYYSSFFRCKFSFLLHFKT